MKKEKKHKIKSTKKSLSREGGGGSGQSRPFGFQTNLEHLKHNQRHSTNTNIPQKSRNLFSKLVLTSYKKLCFLD